ncbi:hypothetical protein C9374_010076 [Naegleria lovaniensis]|uniref:Cytochrome b5 heme-binding domain-containing protein n=1 Tax=Naegleria lovaniensis TaxID=51637 RepID=A0AA88GGB7_NAELO|nr:uncharacterized protein C9374_010076 [Naegleria lovaniensis]KAG2375072.1 hypothetical protein C9374_010076 [Naegleria lovaniensis]
MFSFFFSGKTANPNDISESSPSITSTTTTTTKTSSNSAPPRKREKVTLKPGFGLRQWSMLQMKMPSPNVASLGSIPIGEVAKHDTVEDAWIILRERVYDISKFLDHHPGGVEILKQVLGKDCTELFDEYHSFVNSDFLLEKCFLGYVKRN